MRREPAGPIRSRKKNFRETAPAAQTLAAKLASLVTAQQEDTVHAAMETLPALLSQDLPTLRLTNIHSWQKIGISAPLMSQCQAET